MNNDILSFALLGLVEGLTEFLPVSSSGHLIVTRAVMGLEGADSLAIDAVLQMGTILAVVLYFSKDLLGLLRTFVRLIARKETAEEDRNLLGALMLGTVPGVVFGLLLEKSMESIFRNVHLVSYALIAGSCIFVLAEMVSRRNMTKINLSQLSIVQGIIIGLWQCVALVPGMSRSGMTISGGLFLGLTREAAARFGFLLSIPIILGSGAKKLIDLYGNGALGTIEMPLLVGASVAFVSGLLAIHGLLMFVRTQPLYAFAAYRVFLAASIFAVFPLL